MSVVTQVSVVAKPGSPRPEPAPPRRNVQLLASADGRRAVTTVSSQAPPRR